MKKMVCILLAVLMLLSCLGAGAMAEVISEENIVLQIMAAGSESIEPLQKTAQYVREHGYPNLELEVIVVPGVAEFNTALAAKFSAGDAPDLFIYQWGTNTQLYARSGHLLPLDDVELEGQIADIKLPYHIYEGSTYALPTAIGMFGLHYNYNLAKEYGVDRIPKTYEQWLEDMETMRKNGLESPYIVPAKDGSGAAGYVFGYVNQVISYQNPDFYAQCITGEKDWGGEEWRGLLDSYEKVLAYANPDMLGLDPDNAIQRFCKGEGVYLCSGGGVSVARIRAVNPDPGFEFMYLPFPLFENEEDFAANGDMDEGISIWSGTKYPEAAKAFVEALFVPENAAFYSECVSKISSVRGADGKLDPSMEVLSDLYSQGKITGFFDRIWISGIKEIMKSVIQEWMAGVSTDQTLINLKNEHQRLLDANPEYFIEYEQIMAGAQLD